MPFSANPGIIIGIVALCIGLPIGIIGARIFFSNPEGGPQRRRGAIMMIAGLGTVWIGGFIGAFSSLSAM